MDVDNGFHVASISTIAGGPGDVTGVTINGFAFDTVTTTGSNTGIELGETAIGSSDAINTTITNNTFNDLNVGVQSNQSSGTTRISGATMTNIASRGITFVDSVNAGDTVNIIGNAVTSAGNALHFRSPIAGSVNVTNNSLTSTAATADAVEL